MRDEPKQAEQGFEPVTEEDLQDLEEALPILRQELLFGRTASIAGHFDSELPRMIATIRDLQKQLAERDAHLDWALQIIDGLAARLRGLGYMSRHIQAGESLSSHLICRDCHAEANQEHEAGCNLGFWEQQAKQAAELYLVRKGQPPAQSGQTPEEVTK